MALPPGTASINDFAHAGVPVGTVDGQTVFASLVVTADTSGNPSGDAAATATVTSKAGSTSAQTLLAANALRKGAASFYYDGTAILYLLEGTGTPSITNYTIKLGSSLLTYYETQTDYNGAVQGVFSAAAGAVLVTERTA